MDKNYLDLKNERRTKYSKKVKTKKIKNSKGSMKIKKEELALEEYKNILKDL